MDLLIDDCRLKCYEDGTIERFCINYNKWRKCIPNNQDLYNYLLINHKRYSVHRLMYKAFNPEWDIYSPLEIDHINRQKKDNNINNLRLATSQENDFNRKCKGCSFETKTQKWRGSIKKDGKSYASPRFDTEQEAKDWYLQKKAELHTFMRENNALSRR